MCFQYILILSQQCSNITCRRMQRSLAKLRPICTFSAAPLSFSMGLWYCQSAVNKLSSFPIIGKTQPTLTYAIKNEFTFHEITVTASVELHIIMIYHLPGQLGTFIEKLYGLLSSFSVDGSPLVVFGDFEIHLEALHCKLPLIASFDLKWLTQALTNQAISLTLHTQLYHRQHLVKPLDISAHFFIIFNLHIITCVPPIPLPVTFRQNPCSLSPFILCSVVSSSLPSPTHFSYLDVNTATDTL